MTYQTVPTVVTGDMWTAAQNNTYIRDNFSALWPYTAAGDMAYASSSSTLSKITVGSEGQILNVSSGVPVWTDQTQIFCFLRRNANQSTSGLNTNINFDVEEFDNFGFFNPATPTIVTLPQAGLYKFDGYIRFSPSSTGFYVGSNIYINPTVYLMDNRQSVNSAYAITNFSYLFKATGSTNMNIRGYQNSGSSLSMIASLAITYLGVI